MCTPCIWYMYSASKELYIFKSWQHEFDKFCSCIRVVAELVTHQRIQRTKPLPVRLAHVGPTASVFSVQRILHVMRQLVQYLDQVAVIDVTDFYKHAATARVAVK